MMTRRSAIGRGMGVGLAALTPVRGGAAAPAVATLTIVAQGGRRCAVWRWRPRRAIGTMLFSHGALSAPLKYTALIEPLAAAGWDVWAPLHVDSTDHPDTKAYPGLASWPARIEDMRALARYVGARSYVVAGHSYGALVALTLAGASPTRPQGVEGPLADPRVSCALAFSPPGPGMGLVDAAGYATLARPALIETGTLDVPPGGTDPGSWHSHLTAFEAAAPGGDRYAVVLDGADHYFGGAICRPDLPGPRQSAALDRAIKVSEAFLAGFGAGDRRAADRLRAMVGRGDGAELLRR